MTFEWSAIWDALPSLLEGAKMTIQITLLGLIGGTVIGFLSGVVVTYVKVPVSTRSVLAALATVVALYVFWRLASWVADTFMSGVPEGVWTGIKVAIALLLAWRFFPYLPRALSFLAQVYILIVRGTPIVVQVMFIYFALPLLVGWRIDAVMAAIFTLMINSGAYIAEIVRGALQSVPKGLKEAGEAMGLLTKVGLESRVDHYPGQLSGGQQQRVAIARALAIKPKLMLFDEPTSALDPELRYEVLTVMQDVAEAGMTMVVVTHEMEFARRVGSRLLFMDGGKIAEDGLPAELLNNPPSQRLRDFLQHVT